MDIYKDILQRTDGDIYMGVVGPVRTGKSTFIKRFMELVVIPAIGDEYKRNRAKDELPQSAAGKTIMTTEPKFIPKEAVSIKLNDEVNLKVRMIDCVGYMVDGAEGHQEEGKERLVKTPWFDYDVPFTKAAEIGTKKVIFEHSTVGVVVSCDGSITDIPREGYIEAEKRTVMELKELGKPFVIILNSRKPSSQQTIDLANEMEEEYGIDVLPMNLDQLKMSDVNRIFESLLMNFPITSLEFEIPKWIEAMDNDSEIKSYLISMANNLFSNVYFMKDIAGYRFENDD